MSIKSQPEDEAQNEEDGDLLDGYENDNGDYGPLSDSLDKHSFSRMSHALGGQMFREVSGVRGSSSREKGFCVAAMQTSVHLESMLQSIHTHF
ncbi:hypothetical protein WN944_003658 [Citrus x changshan-huyou]|uniref:Uncharacterized protein n=1 Tax=Citrus x changshan-huyou TaxID=2935761 RepID=A0AAP0LYZ4_9ROSI